MKRLKLLSAALFLVLPFSANADFVTVDISPIVNSNLQSYTFGASYPAPGTLEIGGVPFVTVAGGTENGYIQVAGGVNTSTSNFNLSGLNIEGAIAMYAIINSAWGQCGSVVGSIGVNGASFTLTEGINVRDHFPGNFCNDQTDAFATANYPNRVLFDVYRFDLSGASSPITDLYFSRKGGFPKGSPFLAAVTFETAVPEPGTLALLGIGLISIAARRRKTV